MAIAARKPAAAEQGPDVERDEYALADIKRHLRTFVERFFRTSQFKRSCVPNSPQAAPAARSRRAADWRAPSDSEAAVWLADLARIPE